MTSTYELFMQQAQVNKQLFTLLRFACRCDHVTSIIFNTYESVGAFLAAKNSTIRVRSLSAIDESITNKYTDMAKQLDLDLEFAPVVEKIEPTELLYINSPAEGNFRAQELIKYSEQVSKYIILPNTVANAHQPANNIKLADGINPIGLVFGINHFIQTHDDWFILEHDDVDPGMTVLVNRKNVANAHS
jgi:hypothetical protein